MLISSIQNLDHGLLNLHVASLGIRPIHGVVAAEVSQSATLTTGLLTLCRILARLATEVDTLAPLPALNAKEEQHCLDKYNTPFP